MAVMWVWAGPRGGATARWLRRRWGTSFAKRCRFPWTAAAGVLRQGPLLLYRVKPYMAPLTLLLPALPPWPAPACLQTQSHNQPACSPPNAPLLPVLIFNPCLCNVLP